MKILKIIFCFVIINILYCNIQAQKSEPVWVTSKSPEFPGGDEARQQFFINNLVYPKEAKEKEIEMDVIVDVIIEEDGSFSNVELISFFKDKYKYGLGEEALRVVNSMPNWIPGEKNGKIVRTRWIIPVRFKLDGSPYVYNFSYYDSIVQKEAEEREKVYKCFSTDKTDDSTNGIYKAYHLTLYKDGRYEIYLSETRSHFIAYTGEDSGESVSSQMIMNTTISEGTYIERDEFLILTDKNEPMQLEYQHATDTIIRLPVFPNEIKKCLVPIETFPFLSNLKFYEGR